MLSASIVSLAGWNIYDANATENKSYFHGLSLQGVHGWITDSTESDSAAERASMLRDQFDSLVMSMNGNSVTYGLDTTISPCEDHYQFANGGWRDAVKMPDTRDRRYQMINFFSYAQRRMYDRLEEILDSARLVYSTTTDPTVRALGTFYEACMTADSLESSFFRNRAARNRKTPEPPRNKQCISQTLEQIGGAAGQAFVNDLKNSGAVGKMETLLSELRVAVEERLKSNTIMSDVEKEYALDRLSKLILRVGIPETEVDYSELKLLDNNFHENKKIIANFNNSQWTNSIGSNLREKWKASLLETNAFYMPGDHAIEIPTIMFSPPFFYRDREALYNFAGVGYIIGHEIFHSISPQLPMIADPRMKAETDSFKAFHTSLGEFEGWKTNGARTFNEDVADLGGSRVAYAAWKATLAKDPNYKEETIEGYTPDQRFFIAMGKTWRSKWTKNGISNGVHGPHWARVNAVAMQNPEFNEAFGCKQGDAMVLPPEKVSKIW